MMATTEQARIQEEVYSCVRRMYERFYDPGYKGRGNDVMLRAVETSKDMLNKYQACEEVSLDEKYFFLFDYVHMIIGRKDLKKESLGGIMFKLHALVKIFGPDEKKSSGNNKELEILQRKIDRLQIQKADLEKNLHKERNDKEDLFQRLSMVVADRIKTGNPEIADLSDPNRPIKLAEEFNNLYSNAWSDAFERLQKTSSRKPDSNNEEEEITRLLFEALKSCYEWSQKAADCQKGAIIKAGMGKIDFDNNRMRSNDGKQGSHPSVTSLPQRKVQIQQTQTRSNDANQGFHSAPPQGKIHGQQAQGRSVDENQDSHQSMTWPTQGQMKGKQALERSSAGNQGSHLSMTSPPQDKMQRKQTEEMSGWYTQGPSPRDFQAFCVPKLINPLPDAKLKASSKIKNNERSTEGNQGSHSSVTSPLPVKMQRKQAQEADDQASSVKNADEVNDDKEEMESSVLDYPAQEFMRCAGVESAKRLPERICQKVMEDKTYKDIEVYVQKCAELCWLMRIQFPPIELLFDIKPDGEFDHKYYKPYTTSGERIAFPVWPTMLLHKDGPILSLGVVQCKKI